MQATTAETQNASVESMQTEKATAQNEKASANTEVKRSLSKTKVEKLRSDIRKLGEKRITKDAGGKKITILTDYFTEDKNIFSQSGRKRNEVNERIKNIPQLEQLIKQSQYVGIDTNINTDKDAKKGVKAIHKFSKQAYPDTMSKFLFEIKAKSNTFMK